LKKSAVVDLNLCDPHKCNPENGKCIPAGACTHGIMEQEEPFEPPILLSETLCVGDGDCVKACPLKAVKISTGSFN
jgi:translation initiation factor RLI1